MSEKVKREKKVSETKVTSISTIPLQNTELLAHANIPLTKPSQATPYKYDPDTLKMVTGTENETLAVDMLLRGYTKPLCELYEKEPLTIPFMQEMKPQNVLEGMLCSQILSLHCAGMDNLEKSKNDNIQCQKDSHLSSAVKLLRLQHETIESLMKLRRNGEQKVIVQHVNVNDGGQAVVGGMIKNGGER